MFAVTTVNTRSLIAEHAVAPLLRARLDAVVEIQIGPSYAAANRRRARPAMTRRKRKPSGVG